MVNLLKRMVESLNTRKVRRTAARWLAVLVVFATTYSLVLPAITMSTTLTGDLDGVEVKVEAGKGVLESGTELVLKNVLLPDDEVVTLSAESGEEGQDEDVRQLTQEELDKILEAAVDGNPDLVGKIIKVLDISLDHRGDEIEPNGLVKLHVSSDLIRDAQQPALVHLDDEGNATLIATKFNKDEGTLAEEGDEEPDEDEDLPSVDSEGYLLDENGDRVTDEDGNYTQYEVDEDGSLVLDEDGNPILVVPTEDEETEDKDGEESEKPADGEESEDKDTEESEKPADGEETKDEESEQPTESQKPEESEQPSESQKPEESEQPSESQKPEASEQPSVSQKPEASEQPSESQKPEEPTESQKPADPEPTPETPAAPEQPAAPEVTVPDEDTALASAPASWGDDDPAATEDKTLVGMTDNFSVYAIVDLEPRAEEEEESAEPVELTENVDGGLYQMVFHVTYTGEQAENDELVFTAGSEAFDGEESDRAGEYASAITNPLTQPVGRTWFQLTRNGEAVDRSEYTVSVKIIPSRAMMASLGQTFMSLEETGEEFSEAELEAVGYNLYELKEADEETEAKLVGKGHIDVDFASVDMDSYMAEAYEMDENGEPVVDEDGNPVYTFDEDYAFEAEIQGDDFMIATGAECELVDPLDTFGDDQRYANQGYWWMNVVHHVTVWWEGFRPEGETGITHADANVNEVYLTHFNSATANIDGVPTQIPKGDKGQNTLQFSVGGKPVYLQDIYPAAQPTQKPGNGVGADDNSDSMYDDAYDYVQVENPDEATHFKVDRSLFHEPPLMVSRKNTNLWNEWLATAEAVNGDSPGAMPITYYRQVLPSSPNEGHDFALLEIVPEPGYYVTQVVITCCMKQQHIANGQTNTWYDMPGYKGDAYHLCQVYNDGNAFRQSFSVAEGSRVSLIVDSESFAHSNSIESTTDRTIADSYYIMIQTAPIPSPLYVEYDLGNAALAEAFKNSSEWVSPSTTQTGSNIATVNGNVSWEITKSGADNTWANGDLVFTSGTLTQKVIDYARNTLHKEFDGWQLEYYSAASKSGDNITFREPFNEGSNVIMGAGETKELLTHARLVAKWVDLPVATVTKEVTGLDDSDNQERTFRFKVEGNDKTFTVKTTVKEYVNGILQDVEKTIEVTNGEFEMKVRGNGHQSCRIYGLENGNYTVTETEEAEAKSTTYSVDSVASAGSNAEFTVTGATSSHVVVTNSYTEQQKTVKVKFIKTDGNNPLAGATFELYKKAASTTGAESDTLVRTGTSKITADGKEAIIFEGTNDDGVIELDVSGAYKLIETHEPAGYTNIGERGIIIKDGQVDVTPTLGEGAINKVGDTYVIKIVNNPGTILPSTGGPGTAQFVAFGAALMAAASLVLVLELLKRRGRARA